MSMYMREGVKTQETWVNKSGKSVSITVGTYSSRYIISHTLILNIAYIIKLRIY